MQKNAAALEVGAFLSSFLARAARVPHSGRSLAAHLVGTHDLLSAWGAPPALQLAGLVHTAYGTNSFRPRQLAEFERRRLWAILGREAEYLVYVYAFKSPRRFFDTLDAARATGSLDADRLRDNVLYRSLARHEAAWLVVSAAQVRSVATLMVANALEQWPRSSPRDREDAASLFTYLHDLIPARAQESVAGLCI